MRVIQLQAPTKPILLLVNITDVDYSDNDHLGDSICHFLLEAWKNADQPKDVQVCFSLPSADCVLGSNMALPLLKLWQEMRSLVDPKLYLVNCSEREAPALNKVGLLENENFIVLNDPSAPGYVVAGPRIPWGWIFVIITAFLLWRLI